MVYGKSSVASYTLDDQLEVYGQNTYRYDDDGYLIEKITPQSTTSYNYGTLGELKEVVISSTSTGSVTVISYKQNALNQRVAKLVNGQVVEKYLWKDLTTLLAVYDKDDNLLQRFEYADQRMPLTMTMQGKTYHLHYDQVGTLRVITNAQGQNIKEITYDTYGNILSDSNPSFTIPFGFAGGLYDADTKLTRFGYRDYDAYTGKWTAKDPIGFSGGDSNLYGYVLGDPVGGFDENGLAPTGKWIDCGGGCRIRIDKNHSGNGRHIHWECKNGSIGSCGENDSISHGTDCSNMPKKIRKCAKKHGFNPDKKPEKKENQCEDIVPSPPWWLLPARIGATVGGAVFAP